MRSSERRTAPPAKGLQPLDAEGAREPRRAYHAFVMASTRKQRPRPSLALAELGQSILEALRSTTVLASDAAIAGLLPKPYSSEKQRIPTVVKALAHQGLTTRIKLGSTWYSAARDPRATLASLVERWLADEPLTRDAITERLQRVAPGHEKLVGAWLTEAVAEQRVFIHMPAKGTSERRFSIEPDPRVGLQRTLKALHAELPALTAMGVSTTSVLAVLQSELGLDGSAQTGVESSERVAERARTRRLHAEWELLEALRLLTAEQPPGALLALRELRARSSLDKWSFDRAVLSLSESGKILLHHHDYPSSLPDIEREALVSDDHGTYYVGVALRQFS